MAATSRHSSRWPWVFGGALLIGTLAVSVPLMRDMKDVAAGPNDAAAVQRGLIGQGVVCLGRVDIEGGLLPMVPQQPGAVTEILCYEGQPVRQGSELLKVNEEPFLKKVAEGEAGVQIAEAQLAQARQSLEQFKQLLRQQQAAVDAANAKLAAAQAQLKQAEKVRGLNIPQVSPEEVEQARQAVEGYKAGVIAEEAKLEQIRRGSPEPKIEEAAKNVDFRRAQLEQAREALGRCTLRAPQDGTVLQLLATIGSQYGSQPQQPAVIFAPNGPRIVRVEVDQEFSGRVSLGATATITDEASVGPVYYGKVLRVADAFLPPRNHNFSADLLSGGNNNRVLEAIVSIDPAPTMPKLGQRMRVTIGGANTSR